MGGRGTLWCHLRADHPPVARRHVTWAEFSEAGWLGAYRKNMVPMRELRNFIGLLRDEFGGPYPLAHKTPLASGEARFKTQEAAGLDPYWRLVDEQLLLTCPGQLFMDEVTWEGDLASVAVPPRTPEDLDKRTPLQLLTEVEESLRPLPLHHADLVHRSQPVVDLYDLIRKARGLG